MSTHTESLPTRGDGAADPNRATLAWEAADGRRGWKFSEAQREEILRRRALGEDFTLGPEGELIFYPREATDRRFWMRGPDDPNVRAGQRARRLYVAKSIRRVMSTFSAHSRRTPSARPAARRPTARRSTASSSSSSSSDDPPPADADEGERRDPLVASFRRLRRLTPGVSGASRERLAAKIPGLYASIWAEVAREADRELERYFRGELS